MKYEFRGRYPAIRPSFFILPPLIAQAGACVEKQSAGEVTIFVIVLIKLHKLALKFLGIKNHTDS